MGISPPVEAELVLLDPAPHRRVLLRQGATIGSGPGCAIRLRDPRVEAEHAEVRWDGLRWVLRPLAPGAELAVNDRAVTWTQLADRDVLRIADFLFGFRLGRRERPAAPPTLEADDVAAAATALAEERQAWEIQLRRQRAELAERETRYRARAAQTAAVVMKERDRVAAAERAVVRRAAELDRLAGQLVLAGRQAELEREDRRYDARQLDARFAELGRERAAKFAELAALERLVDAARARLAAVRIESARRNRFGSLGEPPLPFAFAPQRKQLALPDDAPAPWRLAELDERRRGLAARRAEFAAEREEFDRAAAAARQQLRTERDALDRRRQWLDRAAERWANLRAGGDADGLRREWARLRSDLLVERVEILCERDRLAAVEDELPKLRRIVAKQRRLLARAHGEARAARSAWTAERDDRIREAEDLQQALENLVAGLLADAPAAASPAAAPPLRIAA